MEKAPEAFRTISEVAALLDLPQHVLRFWETRFSQLKPMKRAGGRRFYRPSDIEFLKAIQYLLYEKGYTIKGVQRILKENGTAFVTDLGSADKEQIDAVIEKKQKKDLNPVVAETYDEVDFGKDIEWEEQKTHGHSFFGFLRGENEKVHETADEDKPAVRTGKDYAGTVQKVLLELMECKRLLDRSRQG